MQSRLIQQHPHAPPTWYTPGTASFSKTNSSCKAFSPCWHALQNILYKQNPKYHTTIHWDGSLFVCWSNEAVIWCFSAPAASQEGNPDAEWYPNRSSAKIPLHWPDGLNHPVSQMYHFQDLLWCPVMNTIRMFRFRPRDKNIALVGSLHHCFWKEYSSAVDWRSTLSSAK